jgi:hypothetical protein
MHELILAHRDVNLYTYCTGKYQESEFLCSQYVFEYLTLGQACLTYEMLTHTCCCLCAGSLTLDIQIECYERGAKGQTQ